MLFIVLGTTLPRESGPMRKKWNAQVYDQSTRVVTSDDLHVFGLHAQHTAGDFREDDLFPSKSSDQAGYVNNNGLNNSCVGYSRLEINNLGWSLVLLDYQFIYSK